MSHLLCSIVLVLIRTRSLWNRFTWLLKTLCWRNHRFIWTMINIAVSASRFVFQYSNMISYIVNIQESIYFKCLLDSVLIFGNQDNHDADLWFKNHLIDLINLINESRYFVLFHDDSIISNPWLMSPWWSNLPSITNNLCTGVYD